MEVYQKEDALTQARRALPSRSPEHNLKLVQRDNFSGYTNVNVQTAARPKMLKAGSFDLGNGSEHFYVEVGSAPNKTNLGSFKTNVAAAVCVARYNARHTLPPLQQLMPPPTSQPPASRDNSSVASDASHVSELSGFAVHSSSRGRIRPAEGGVGDGAGRRPKKPKGPTSSNGEAGPSTGEVGPSTALTVSAEDAEGGAEQEVEVVEVVAVLAPSAVAAKRRATWEKCRSEREHADNNLEDADARVAAANAAVEKAKAEKEAALRAQQAAVQVQATASQAESTAFARHQECEAQEKEEEAIAEEEAAALEAMRKVTARKSALEEARSKMCDSESA